MNEEIKQVQSYFLQHLIAGVFEVVKIDRHIITVSIEGKDFTFWMANQEQFFDQYHEFNHPNFMLLDMKGEVKAAIYKTLCEIKIKHDREIKENEMKRKLAEYEELKAELEHERAI